MARKTDETDAFFRAFKADAKVDADRYEAVAFSDDAAMADQLLGLVLSGVKRATVSLARDYGPETEPLPAVGDYVVLVDSRNKPRCVWRTTEISVKPLGEIDDQFIRSEGDQIPDGELGDHRDYLQRQADRGGFSLHDDIETVFERCTIVWPRLFADGPKKLSF